MWNHTFTIPWVAMRQTISRHCRMRHLKQQKRRENACIKALVFTAQASCGLKHIEKIEVGGLYLSFCFKYSSSFLCLKLFVGLLPQVC